MISWLQGGHHAVHATPCSYTHVITWQASLTHSVRDVSRDQMFMFPLPHEPNQLPTQLQCETLAVLATRRIFAPAQLVQKWTMLAQQMMPCQTQSGLPRASHVAPPRARARPSRAAARPRRYLGRRYLGRDARQMMPLFIFEKIGIKV